MRAKRSGVRTCSKCREAKDLESFNVDRSRPLGRTYVCIACRMAGGPNPGARERRLQVAKGLSWCRGCQAWMDAALVSQGACRRCHNVEAAARYRNDPHHRERRRAHAYRRKRGIDRVPDFAADLMRETFDGRCAYCPDLAQTFDHVVAAIHGGLTEPGNIVPACSSCNSSKRDRDVWSWLESTGRTPHPWLAEAIIGGRMGVQPSRGPLAL